MIVFDLQPAVLCLGVITNSVPDGPNGVIQAGNQIHKIKEKVDGWSRKKNLFFHINYI